MKSGTAGANTTAPTAREALEVMTGRLLRELREGVRRVVRMEPQERSDWFEAGRAGGLQDRLVVRRVWEAVIGVAGDFKGRLEDVPNWALPVLRELIARPPLGGVMSVTKLRMLDARMRRQAKPRIGRAGL